LRSPDEMPPERADGSPTLPAHQAWLQGLLSALLNPKLGVFFLTLLPQFIAPGEPAALRALQLALVFDVIGLAWLLLYPAMLAAVGDALGRSGPRRFIRWVSGTVLIALGVRVALERA
jgi:threonine/homoserine/homoserine lactone efflux protein